MERKKEKPFYPKEWLLRDWNDNRYAIFTQRYRKNTTQMFLQHIITNAKISQFIRTNQSLRNWPQVLQVFNNYFLSSRKIWIMYPTLNQF